MPSPTCGPDLSIICSLKLVVDRVEHSTVIYSFYWFEIRQVGVIPAFVKVAVGLRDEELTVELYEQVTKVTCRLASANDSRDQGACIAYLSIECDNLHLCMDKTSSSLSINKRYV